MAKSQNIQSISSLVLAMQDGEERKKKVAQRRQESKLKQDLFQKSREGRHETPWGDPMKMVRVSSNYARDRVVMIAGGKLILHFDYQGFAEMPEHKLALLKAEIRVRPGRYRILAEESQAPVVETVDKTAVTMREQVQHLLEALTEPEEEPEEEEPKEEEELDAYPELVIEIEVDEPHAKEEPEVTEEE